MRESYTLEDFLKGSWGCAIADTALLAGKIESVDIFKHGIRVMGLVIIERTVIVFVFLDGSGFRGEFLNKRVIRSDERGENLIDPFRGCAFLDWEETDIDG